MRKKQFQVSEVRTCHFTGLILESACKAHCIVAFVFFFVQMKMSVGEACPPVSPKLVAWDIIFEYRSLCLYLVWYMDQPGLIKIS